MSILATTDFAVTYERERHNLTGTCPRCARPIRYDAILCRGCFLEVMNAATRSPDPTPAELAEWSTFRLLRALRDGEMEAVVWP